MNWLIKRLGGYTREEYEAVPELWHQAIAAMERQGRVTILEGQGSVISNAHIVGALITAPFSYANVIGCYFETDRHFTAP